MGEEGKTIGTLHAKRREDSKKKTFYLLLTFLNGGIADAAPPLFFLSGVELQQGVDKRSTFLVCTS